MSQIVVNYAQMEAAHSQMKSISQAIDSKLDTLRAQLDQMQWSGQDRDAYVAHKAAWDRAIKDINTILNEIGGAVGVARQNYMTTEINNAKVWGG
jgi:ESAT-6 family protein